MGDNKLQIKTILKGVLLATVFLTGTQVAAAPAHDFTLSTDGGTISLSQYKGQVVYIDFWASWCGPCRQSFPWMSKMQQRYGEQGFKVIAINLDKEAELRDKFTAANQPRFTIAYDPEGTVAEKYNVTVMPTSYLIDRDGNIHTQHLGFNDKDSSRLERKIEALLQ